MSINYESLDLRAFLAVIELSGFHRAAEQLSMSQPALSRRIQRLEVSLGGALLERTTRSVGLTSYGREFLPVARRMLEDFDNSIFTMQKPEQFRATTITIGCIPTAAFYFLPEVIGRFKALYPATRFRILDLSANDVVAAVSRGEVEFGINLLGALEPDVSFEALLDEPFVLACRKDHPLARKSEVEWSDLKDHPLVTVSRASGNRMILDAALVKAGVSLHWTYEVNHLSTSLGLVEAGLGVSVLPALATPRKPHPILINRPMIKPSIARTIGVMRRQGSRPSPPAERFLQLLLGTWKS